MAILSTVDLKWLSMFESVGRKRFFGVEGFLNHVGLAVRNDVK